MPALMCDVPAFVIARAAKHLQNVRVRADRQHELRLAHKAASLVARRAAQLLDRDDAAVPLAFVHNAVLAAAQHSAAIDAHAGKLDRVQRLKLGRLAVLLLLLRKEGRVVGRLHRRHGRHAGVVLVVLLLVGWRRQRRVTIASRRLRLVGAAACAPDDQRRRNTDTATTHNDGGAGTAV